MLDALLNVLNGCTDIPFVELAWSHAPDDKYGVINLDNQIALDADADPVSEKMLTGFVDVFVRKPKNLSTVKIVENAMKALGIWFKLNSVQFEDDTGYLHYEWIWRDTLGKVEQHMYISPIFVTMYDENINMGELIEAAKNGATVIGKYYDEDVCVYSSTVVFNEDIPANVFTFEFYDIDQDTGFIKITTVALASNGTFNGDEYVIRTGGAYFVFPNVFSYAEIEGAISRGSEIILVESTADPSGNAGQMTGRLRRRLTWYGHDSENYYVTFDNENSYYAQNSTDAMTEF